MYTKKETGYYVNRHSCFLLTYHVVLVTKYRKPVLQGKVKKLVCGIIRDILEERGCTLKELNGEADHIHILFDAGPEVQILDLVRVIKTKTARFARKQFPEELKEYFWKPVFWTDSYFATTVGGATRNMVEQYIRKQGQKQP